MADSEHDSEFEEALLMDADYCNDDPAEEDELESLLELSSSELLF